MGKVRSRDVRDRLYRLNMMEQPKWDEVNTNEYFWIYFLSSWIEEKPHRS